MSHEKLIRVYDYVNYPYEKVSEHLAAHSVDLFRDATKNAATKVRSLASELHVNLGGFEISADISIEVKKVTEKQKSAGSGTATLIDLEWKAAKLPGFFPLMKATLSLYPLTATETQLELCGSYEPPFGFLGSAMDLVVLHRIAESSVHQFITDVAVYLRHDLAKTD